MAVNSLEELFNLNLQKLYDVENQLIEAIPIMADNSQSGELKDALTRHLQTTKNQMKRLEEIAQQRGLTLTRVSDEGMMSMLKQDQEMMKQIPNGELKDAVIMGGTEKVEHYETAAYQSAKILAQKIGAKDIAEKLDQTLKEEKQAADKINMLGNGGLMGKIGDILP
jgi:ferritin-like metal-binding protein YciE